MTTALASGPLTALRQLVGSSRPLSWINTAYPFAAAYLLGGGGAGPVLVVGTIFFLIPYNLLMYGVNDVFDHESDLRNPRKGGVEGVVLDTRWHTLTLWAAGLLCLPFVIALALWGTAASTALLVGVLAAVVGYSAPRIRLKERAVLDSATSSAHFVGPAAVGLALAGAEPSGPAVLALIAFFLWGMASHAVGAVQDIVPDRAAGIGSIATALGARATIRTAAALYAASGLLLLALPWPGTLAVLLVIPYLANIAPHLALTDASSGRAHAAWRRFLVLNLVAGALLTQLVIVELLGR
ncbi:prenyltransferase [Brachybacterium sp. DNPG3]